MADDFSADIHTTGLFPGYHGQSGYISVEASGEIEAPLDEDWFAVDLLEGQLYSLSYISDGRLPSTVITGLFDAAGQRLEEGENLNYSRSQVLFQPEASGKYFFGLSNPVETDQYRVFLDALSHNTGIHNLTDILLGVGRRDTDFVVKAAGEHMLSLRNLNGAIDSNPPDSLDAVGVHINLIDGFISFQPYQTEARLEIEDFVRAEASAWHDTITAGAAEHLDGLGGNDHISVVSGAEVFGGSGDDRISLLGGNNRVDGGTGTDTVVLPGALSSYSAATTDFGWQLQRAGGVSNEINNAVEHIQFGDQTLTIDELSSLFANVVEGTDNAEVLRGTDRFDHLMGRGGNDWLLPGEGADTVDGGAGTDMVSYANVAGPLRISLNSAEQFVSGALKYDTLVSIEAVTGSSSDDSFFAPNGSFRGLGGADTFYAEFFGSGSGVFDGGTGTDTVDYRHADAGVSISLLRDRGFSGEAQQDRFVSIENLVGSNHDDLIWGDRLGNVLDGRHGNDTIQGGGGDDLILAGHGTDVVVFGGNRADYDVQQNGFRVDVEYVATRPDGFDDGHDIVLHAEVLRFADGDLML